MPKSPRNRESGYALLFIFLTMAIVGITLYAAMPRVAFEAQRDQEELLIDRGEQYKRAIQLYYRKFKKYPVKMEDLENSNGQRFLRNTYVDPMTGKSEWRLIHVGPGGVLTDSLTQKKTQTTQNQSSVNNFITELKPMDGGGDPLNTGTNIGLRRRPSDGQVADGVDQAFGAGTTGTPPDPNYPGATPVNNPTNNGVGFGQAVDANASNGAVANNLANNLANNGQPSGSQQPGGGADMIRNLLTSPRPGGPPPGVFGAGQVNDVGFVNGSKTGPSWQNNTGPTGSNSDPSAGQASSSVFANNSGPASSANSLPTPGTVQNVFSPVTSGGTGGTGLNSSGTPGQTIGGGIAGIASKAGRPGIKIYKDHQKYNEWEFIYDYAKDTTQGGGQQQIPPTQPNGPAGVSGVQGQNAQGQNNSTTTTGQTTSQNNGQFGNQPGTTSTGGTSNGQTTTPAFPVIPPSN
jgi:type II secretory pathway pseudopilin PulG